MSGFMKGGTVSLARSLALAPVLVLALVLSALVMAAAPAAGFDGGARNLRFERVSITDGLSQESVLNILQDRQGFMWFGTQAGLNRYDGYRFTVYRNDPRDPASLPDGYVNASFEDAEGRLWFGTKGGLARFDPASGKFVRYRLPGAATPKDGNRSVNAIVADVRGRLWLGTSDGLKWLDPVSGAAGELPAAAGGEIVSALALDDKGTLWVGGTHGLGRLRPGADAVDYLPPSSGEARPARVRALSMGPRDGLWVGTDNGLEVWNLTEAIPRRRVVDEAGLNGSRVISLYHDAGGTLWVGTDLDGLKWRDPTDGRFVTYRSQPLDPTSLSDDQVSAVRIDRTGTLWVGTRSGGVNRTDLASGGFSNFSFRPSNGYRIGYAQVQDVAVGGDGKIWLGTTGGGLVLFDPATGETGQFRHQPGRDDSLPGDVIQGLSVIGDRLWVGTVGAVAWRDAKGGPFHRIALPDLGTAPVKDVVRTRDGAHWAVTRVGLYELEPDLKLRRIWRHDASGSGNAAGNVAGSMADNNVHSLVEDADGMLWIGTDNGLDRFDRASGVFTHFRHDELDPASLRHSRIYDVKLTSKGELWVGTAGGLHRMEKDAAGRTVFRFVRVSDTREASPVGAILEGVRGQLWVSLTDGISRLDPRTGRFKHYSAKDGLLDGTYFVGAGARGPDGRLHFGGVNGLTSFAPDGIRDNPFPPKVAITDFRVANRPRALAPPAGGDIVLPHHESAFSLEFAALHYAAPSSNRYSYRLEGFDEAWIDTDAGKRFASYTNLDPGRYVFRVRASNKDGVWSEAPVALNITITPPWWKTWWFRLLAAAMLAGGAIAAYRLRVRALVQAKSVLERQVNARTAELVLQKDAAERRKREAEQQKEAADGARRNIALLSDIGRRLTANLDTEAIMTTLYEHVQVLMDAPVFAVAVARADGVLFDFPYAMIEGRRCTPAARERRDPRQLAGWCIEQAREVFINELRIEAGRYLPAAEPEAVAAAALPCAQENRLPRALLYVPVAVGPRVLGALCVQSFRPAAYQRVHLDMLRTLAAYVGVALDNAQAYRQLKDAQAQLAAQEKLASLGSLVAGVAHELNTPIGNSLLMASTLHEKTQRIHAALDAAALRRSELAGYIGAAEEASELIMRSLHGAADLVNSFRQVSVDQASAARRRFDLARACQEIMATMMNQVRLAGHTLELDVPAGIGMDSYPGPLGQVLINFVNNALLHAFEGPGGHMRLSARLLDERWVRLRFHDDGRGIATEHLARVFDPFFTTRMGQGGTGLGLNIAHTIATSLLGGAIRVESAPGEGSTFILELPLVAAEARVVAGEDKRPA